MALGCPVCGLLLDASEVDDLGLGLELPEREPADSMQAGTIFGAEVLHPTKRR